jgi:hypothetical protein
MSDCNKFCNVYCVVRFGVDRKSGEYGYSEGDIPVVVLLSYVFRWPLLNQEH